MAGAGAIRALMGAALMISARGRIGAALTIERQQRLRDPRLDFGFTVEAADDAFDDMAKVDLDIGLHRDIDVGAIMAGQSGQAIECLADRIEPGERDFERTLLLGLSRDLINPVAQLEIGAAERLFRWQQRKGRRAARRLLGDGVRRSELEAIGAVAVNARLCQPIGLRHPRDRLAGGEAAVDVRTIEMLACVTSPHGRN